MNIEVGNNTSGTSATLSVTETMCLSVDVTSNFTSLHILEHISHMNTAGDFGRPKQHILQDFATDPVSFQEE